VSLFTYALFTLQGTSVCEWLPSTLEMTEFHQLVAITSTVISESRKQKILILSSA